MGTIAASPHELPGLRYFHGGIYPGRCYAYGLDAYLEIVYGVLEPRRQLALWTILDWRDSVR